MSDCFLVPTLVVRRDAVGYWHHHVHHSDLSDSHDVGVETGKLDIGFGIHLLLFVYFEGDTHC
jgi:hypothetical protein